MNRNLFYMMLFITLAFLVMDLVMVFTRKPPFEVVYYRARMEYDYTGDATFTTVAGLYFKKESAKEKYIQAYKEGGLKTFKEYFKDVSKRLGREIVPVSFDSTMTERPGILEIKERAFLKGAAVVDENGIVDTSMGNLMLNTTGDSEVRVVIPEDATTLSVYPTPTEILKNEIVWKNVGNGMRFPEVRFKRR